MADKRENATYQFIIKNITRQSASSAVAKTADTAQNPQSPKDTQAGSGALKSTLVAYSKVKPWINQIVSAEVNFVELRTGARDLQEKYGFAWQIASGAFDMGESVAMGYAIGNLPGAVVGATVGVVHKVVNYTYAKTRLATQETLQNQSIRQNMERAGSRGSRGGYND